MNEQIISFIRAKVLAYIPKLIKQKRWQLLFTDTGQKMFTHSQTEKAFQNDFLSIISEKNMKQLAK